MALLQPSATVDVRLFAVCRMCLESVMNRISTVLLIVWALAVGVSAQIPDFTPQTPLIGALLHNDMQEATRLLERGADPNEGRFAGFPPVMLAIQRGDLPLLRLMIARGADLTIRDASGSTPLMWAAANESAEIAVVQELLSRGLDPLVANKAGETALDWASRRGDTPVVALLRGAGASDASRVIASVNKAVSLLQRSGAQFAKQSGCYSCHHSSLPLMAVGAARSRGLPVDEAVVRDQTALTATLLRSVAEEALTNRDRIPDPPIAVSYGLLGLAANGYPADDVTAAMSTVIAAWQGEAGAFHTLPPIRVPLEASDVSATALSLRAIQLYGSHPESRVARARDWLRDATPRSTEDHAMRLLGLAWAGASATDLRAAASALLALQREDGGWAQLPGVESDAYATGQALVALATANAAVAGAEYRRGVAFLMRTQFPDGSWLVRTRSYPVQPMKDTGFPHGRHQWISAAGTSWAAMALALSLPPAPPGTFDQR
jgi:ankyrin repeat protein